MNAPLRALDVCELDVDDFREFCEIEACFFENGWVSWHHAIDTCQWIADRWKLVATIGQDAVQSLLSDIFAPNYSEDERAPCSEIVRRWEMNDPRDRWRHTGEPPPPLVPEDPWPPRRAYSTPESTVAAFWVVLRTEPPERLKAWLSDHPRDAAALHNLWKSKCSIAAA